MWLLVVGRNPHTVAGRLRRLHGAIGDGSCRRGLGLAPVLQPLEHAADEAQRLARACDIFNDMFDVEC